MILKDKVVIVTGASEGIGRAIAERLAQEGTKLALIARSENKLREAAAAVGGEAFVCDVRDKVQVKATVEAIAAKFGRIDVLVNSAGIWQKEGPLEGVSDEAIDDIITTNLSGTIYMTKSTLPFLRGEEEKAILQIVSKSGVLARAGQIVYTASKYGVRGFTDVLREDLKGTNIRVGAVYQSGTNTQMFAKTGDDARAADTVKFTQPEDLADAIVYMLSCPPKMWLQEIQVSY